MLDTASGEVCFITFSFFNGDKIHFLVKDVNQIDFSLC